MMEIQKGIVKYKDRNDIVCCYGVCGDGRQYYFLDENDEKKFSNGNRIASLALVEAIDPMVKASNIGVVSPDGIEVIPFNNKSIRPINDDIILIEKAEPVSQSVKAAIELRNDPAFATQLVSTPATIKERLNQRMGEMGRYFFNDQFSEATICDINGNNLVDDEYFSFIGMAHDKLYLSKNTVDSVITEYSVLPPEVQSDVTPNNDSNDINVNDTIVSRDVVEGALSGEDSSAVQDKVDNYNFSLPNIGEDKVEQEHSGSLEDIIEDEINSDDLLVDNGGGEENQELQINFEAVDDINDEEEADDSLEEQKTENDIDDDVDSFDEDIFKNSLIKADAIVGDYEDEFEEDDFRDMDSKSQKDSIMLDVAKSMANLIKQNKEQRNIISDYQEKLEKLNNFRRGIADKMKQQEMRIENLTTKLKNMEKNLAKLEGRNQVLESKSREQDKIIAAQAREIDELRPQLAGKEDLVKVLADAQVLLDDDNFSYEY